MRYLALRQRAAFATGRVADGVRAEIAREKVLAGITSEQEVAAVLGLVESKRQHSNRAYAEAARPVVSESMQEAINHRDDFIEGEIVG